MLLSRSGAETGTGAEQLVLWTCIIRCCYSGPEGNRKRVTYLYCTNDICALRNIQPSEISPHRQMKQPPKASRSHPFTHKTAFSRLHPFKQSEARLPTASGTRLPHVCSVPRDTCKSTPSTRRLHGDPPSRHELGRTQKSCAWRGFAR